MTVASNREQRYADWYARVRHLLEAGDFKSSFADGYPFATADDTPRAALEGPLEEATIGLVSTAGLYVRGEQAPFDAEHPEGDATFRAFPLDTPRDRLAIAHTHYDHTAAEQDLNVVLPVERLRALADEGFVAGVGPTVYSISGYATRWHEIEDSTAPAIAAGLARDGVDAALLVPVWPICHQSVGLVQREVERRGIPTVSLSNLKSRSLMLKLPRVLVTRFARGMAIGEPGNAAQQLDVLRAALRLLDAPDLEAGWGEFPPEAR